LWTVGDLTPGQSVTLSIPIVVTSGQSAPPPGAVISFDGAATANDGSAVETRRSLPVRTNRALELEIDDSPKPVGLGESLRYTLTFGNRSTGLVAGAVLEMAVPEGTLFQSASDGGTIVDGKVMWSLGDLGPGATGVRELIVQVDADLVEGASLLASCTRGHAGREWLTADGQRHRRTRSGEPW
jgi:uncharacterized repeat protein (TIGR01451 family)